MKTETLKSIFTISKVRIALALSFFFCMGLGSFQSSQAQLKNQRRVTAVQLGTAAEGSRVTVSSDTAINDYEAFRRGDRFYVKIPWADFVSAAPRFRGDGFDDVQVQKVGDGVVVSFKLQPGAMARIDQRGNHLDVIFSVAKKAFNAPAIADANRNNPGNLSPYTSASSTNDGFAGPLPPGSATRERYAESFDQSTFGRTSRSSRSAKRRSTTTANDLSGTQALSAASPLPSPAPTFSPVTSAGYPPLATVSPSQLTPNSNSSTAPSASNVSSWGDRKAAITRWISANRLATLLGALILLSLIIYLISGLRRRSATAVKNRDVKSKVQPKYSANDSLEELSPKQTEKLSDSERVVANKETSVAASEPSRPWTLPKRNTATAATEDIDKEDREVFEL